MKNLLTALKWLINFLIFSVIPEFKTDTIFTEKNSAIFRKVANGLIAYSVLIFFIRLIEKSFEITLEYGISASYTLGKNFGTALSGRISLLVIAIFLLIIAQLFKEGYRLKQENDLTI